MNLLFNEPISQLVKLHVMTTVKSSAENYNSTEVSNIKIYINAMNVIFLMRQLEQNNKYAETEDEGKRRINKAKHGVENNGAPESKVSAGCRCNKIKKIDDSAD